MQTQTLNVITFAASLAGQTIDLEAGEIEIRDAVTIDGSELVAAITIDAGSRSRIFSITSTADDVTLRSLVLAGGNAADGIADGGGEDGGTIRSATHGQLSLEGVSITGSRAGDGGHPVPYSSLPGGPGGHGGAIHAAGDVWLIRSTISGSSAGKGGNPYDPFVEWRRGWKRWRGACGWQCNTHRERRERKLRRRWRFGHLLGRRRQRRWDLGRGYGDADRQYRHR